MTDIIVINYKNYYIIFLSSPKPNFSLDTHNSRRSESGTLRFLLPSVCLNPLSIDATWRVIEWTYPSGKQLYNGLLLKQVIHNNNIIIYLSLSLPKMYSICTLFHSQFLVVNKSTYSSKVLTYVSRSNKFVKQVAPEIFRKSIFQKLSIMGWIIISWLDCYRTLPERCRKLPAETVLNEQFLDRHVLLGYPTSEMRPLPILTGFSFFTLLKFYTISSLEIENNKILIKIIILLLCILE